jgi:large subunit ribosomal protein L23
MSAMPLRKPKQEKPEAKKTAPKQKVETKKHKPVKIMSLNPRLSEKAYNLAEQHNTYIFNVETDKNKLDVAQGVSTQYDVTVIKVRVASVPGKLKKTYRQRGRKSMSGRRSDVRKAYVTLKEGDKLPIFDAVEAPEAPKENK